MTDEIRVESTKLRISGLFIPGACTDYVQPLNVAIYQPSKKLAVGHKENKKEQYESRKYNHVWNRRILLTHVVAEAWTEFHSTYQPTIIEAFWRTLRVLLAKAAAVRVGLDRVTRRY